MSRFQWHWHRLRAMSPGEIAGHARKRMFQFADVRWAGEAGEVEVGHAGGFPKLPDPEAAPQVLRDALRRDAENIMAGRWRAFGQIEIQVDDPPKWHYDYLAGKDLATSASAFTLNHRSLPGGADVKLIWELSRWNQLVRLAQATCVLGDDAAGRKCLDWLGNWVENNPPYRGWNWTSALEAGLRLIQFTWIDALLSGRTEIFGSKVELEGLRSQILPAHVRFVWRYKSFGSSANNHLLGELSGLIVAGTHWFSLEKWGAPLPELQRRWEREVLAQFADDGGNKEQALNYQLFSFEFAFQARAALRAAGRKISPPVDERLRCAAQFFVDAQVPSDAWDYGDSDNATVSPMFLDEISAVKEWHQWFTDSEKSPALEYWWGAERRQAGLSGRILKSPDLIWTYYETSGLALWRDRNWTLRWDLSPLGYLKTAAHGHLDALHLSIWLGGVAMVIDPGTGAYYGDKKLRSWLASRAAHNGPCPEGEEWPRRLGPFLWSRHHSKPAWENLGGDAVRGELILPEGEIIREITKSNEGKGWQVADRFSPLNGKVGKFSVRWQFAPGSQVTQVGERKYSSTRKGVEFAIEVSEDWAEARLFNAPVLQQTDHSGSEYDGVVSPGFRQVETAPFLRLSALSGEKPCLFYTTFLASAPQ